MTSKVTPPSSLLSHHHHLSFLIQSNSDACLLNVVLFNRDMAYAAVDSLSYTLKNLDILNITESVWDEFNLLDHTLQRLDYRCYRGIDRSEINELEAKITEAAWKLEDVIEPYQISQGLDQKGMEQEIHSFFKTVEKLREDYNRVLENSWVAKEDIMDVDAAAAVSRIQDNSTTVGLSDLSEEIISGLLDYNSEGKMSTIWGMAGIGKTHLARDIYHHPLIVKHFQLRLWVSIGPNYKDTKNILVNILAQISSKPRDLFKEKHGHELRDLLWDSLSEYQEYLVVFDDVWDMGTLMEYKQSFPGGHQIEPKILMTTRLLDLAKEVSGNKIYQMPFLSNEESWNLLSHNVFGEKPFPTQLEKPGRKIAEICEGLPLLILTVADILRGLDQTVECWNKVAEGKTTTFQDAYDQIYNVLVLSYDYLPQRYKACFLYMGVFRQSQVIPASKLIHLWIVEGLFRNKLILEVLVSNSLVIVAKHSSKSTIKSCRLHIAYWYVSITEARKTKLFHVLNKLTDVSIERPRRLSVQNNMLFGLKEVHDSMAAATSLTRSLLFTGEDHQYPVQICFDTMLLMRVLDALAIRFYEFPNKVLNVLQLSYLALTHNGELPSSISKLQRLQFLILRRHHNIKLLLQRDSTTCLPKEIWDLQKLWYLRIMGSNLPDPSRGVELPNLSRLYVNAYSCTEGVLKSTPALQKLGIEIESQPEGGVETLRCLEHTRLLDRLKSLKCVVVNPQLKSQVVAPPDHLSKLPRSLKKLSLKGLGYPWKYISAIGSLPNLKVLKLRCCAFRGPVWEIKDRQFRSLKYLLLEDIDVVHWTVEGRLQCLRHLIFRHCYKLKTIYFSHFPDMNRLEVDECSPAVVEFAQRRRKSHFKVEINSSWNL